MSVGQCEYVRRLYDCVSASSKYFAWTKLSTFTFKQPVCTASRKINTFTSSSGMFCLSLAINQSINPAAEFLSLCIYISLLPPILHLFFFPSNHTSQLHYTSPSHLPSLPPSLTPLPSSLILFAGFHLNLNRSGSVRSTEGLKRAKQRQSRVPHCPLVPVWSSNCHAT